MSETAGSERASTGCNCSQEDVHNYGPCDENCRSLTVENAKMTGKRDFDGHTPGPWFLIRPECVGGPIEPGWEEAGCGIAHCGMRARTQEEAQANARLIAAAPDLLAELSRLSAETERLREKMKLIALGSKDEFAKRIAREALEPAP